jgi:aspartate-semialdehyde dehydrogenase
VTTAKKKLPVGILGATGMVGQRFIQLLEHHPWFEITWLAASDRSSGKLYGDAVRWKISTPLPHRISQLRISPATPDGAPRIIFAALEADIARELEPLFANAGCAVISNSSAFRMAPGVPLVIPEVNADQLALIERQPSHIANGGYIVTNPNCCAVGLAMALKPLQHAFGLEAVFVSTMQAVSGAGYPGVSAMDILGNVVPYIKNEEEKLEQETLKLLGSLSNGTVHPLDARITAHCNRVAVEDGHTECVSVKFRTPATHDHILDVWHEFRPLAEAGLPSAPEHPIDYLDALDRPQPRLDVGRGKGMTTTIGRLRPCGLLDFKFTLLSHNTIRGAAGAALLNAEMLKVAGKFAAQIAPAAAPDLVGPTA